MGEVVSLRTREVLQADEPEAAEVPPKSFEEWRDDAVCTLLDRADDLAECEDVNEAARVIDGLRASLPELPTPPADG